MSFWPQGGSKRLYENRLIAIDYLHASFQYFGSRRRANFRSLIEHEVIVSNCLKYSRNLLKWRQITTYDIYLICSNYPSVGESIEASYLI